MNVVNICFLEDLLSPLTGLADDDEMVQYYSDINLSAETQYKQIIDEYIKGYFCKLNKEKKNKLKMALRYSLSKEGFDFARIFESCLLPFEPPINVRSFFIWIWEELFREEDYMISNLEEYKVIEDIYEPNRP